MKIGNISSMNFRGIYELKNVVRSSTAKNVPASAWQKGNEDLKFANITYRPFIDEVVNERKVKNAVKGVLVEHYYENADKYCASAIVPKITIGKKLNCTQEEWERVNERKASSTKPNLSQCISYADDFGVEIRDLTPAETKAIIREN